MRQGEDLEGYYLDEWWDLGGGEPLCSVMGNKSIVVLSQCSFVQPSSSVFLRSASPAARSNLNVVFATVYNIMICK